LNDEFFVVPITTSDNQVRVGIPQHLFHAHASRVGVPFDASLDGKRLLVNMVEEERVVPLNLLINWPAAVAKQ
jgi:hypothetical protein